MGSVLILNRILSSKKDEREERTCTHFFSDVFISAPFIPWRESFKETICFNPFSILLARMKMWIWLKSGWMSNWDNIQLPYDTIFNEGIRTQIRIWLNFKHDGTFSTQSHLQSTDETNLITKWNIVLCD